MDTVGDKHFETLIIGAGQAGLATGYHLARRGRPFAILDAHERIGDTWRERWDSLRLFTPARYNGLPGMAFPGPGFGFPTKDEMAGYLQAYAERFALPVHSGVRVDAVTRDGERFLVDAGAQQYTSDNLVVAMGHSQQPSVPAYAARLHPATAQLHSSAYRHPGQVAAGTVLVVGAGNSGAEIALELSRTHRVMLAGRDPGEVPFRIEGRPSRILLSRIVLRLVFHHVLTVANPLGRRARVAVTAHGGPRVRTRRRDLLAAGVAFLPRISGVHDGRLRTEDGRTIEADTVIWCTGYRPGLSWLKVPLLDNGEPRHERGIVADVPGLYLVGQHFQYAVSSGMVQGAGRDAERVAAAIAQSCHDASRFLSAPRSPLRNR
jgi:putative flavoprotein involved in K+ transport